MPHTLECIVAHVPQSLSYEIIVADNGSEDNTVKIAKRYAKVLVDKKATVGGLRNLAVKSSNGDVLVFLDADVSLTNTWCKNFISTYESLLNDIYQVTGSRCAIPSSASWVERIWFKPLVSQESGYINSGHLITSRILFDLIGGFDESLETGEDYAFGKAAHVLNAVIINNALLKVVHEGYPKSLTHFIKREIWHGKGDCKSLNSLFSSKIAVASLGFFFLHLVLLISAAGASYMLSLISLILIILMCFSAAILKHKVRKVRDVLQISFLYYFYFSSRLLSCFPSFSNKSSRCNVE